MITLDVADLIVIAGRVLGIGSEAALGQADIAAAQAALTEARLTGSVIVDQDTAAAVGSGSCTHCFATDRSGCTVRLTVTSRGLATSCP